MMQNQPPPVVSQVPISKMLAPPLKIYLDASDAIMTTVDSMLVWDRRTKEFRGEIGPDIPGLAKNKHIMFTTIMNNILRYITFKFTLIYLNYVYLVCYIRKIFLVLYAECNEMPIIKE